jgi:hypothetical protein
MGNPEGKSPLGRPILKQEGNFKMDLMTIGWGGIDWIYLAHDRDQWRALLNTIMKF